MNRSLAPLIVLLALAWPAHGQAADNITNGRIVTLKNVSGLEQQIRDVQREVDGHAWLGYTVPMIAGDHDLCCHGSRGEQEAAGGCRLDGNSFSVHTDDELSPPTPGPRRLRVLLRLDGRGQSKIRVFGEECALDAGGATVHLLQGVGLEESIAFLSKRVEVEERDEWEGALTAIAFHDGDRARAELRRIAGSGRRDRVRAQSTFWLGATGGADDVRFLKRLIREDPSEKVREQAVFAISIAEAPNVIDLLIDLARSDRSSKVRSTALFWLAEKAGEKAVGAIRDALDEDPDAEVREEAVFALSQLPPERAVPMLIDVARSNRHPEVRKAAMFWLGQTGDRRALEFFEEVLTR